MPALIDPTRSYVAGRWVDGDTPFAVENPADESTVVEVAATPLVEIERAVTEARRSFDDGVWADLTPVERAARVGALLDHLATLEDDLVHTMVLEAGQPVGFAQGAQFTMGMGLARNTIDLYLSLRHEEPNPVPPDELLQARVALSLRRHEPIGVVSAITPYNGAIIMAFQKVVPALLAGNSVVLRPSPLTPISSLAFGAAAEAAGLPAGVLSVVVEESAAGAEQLTTHPAVDMVSFTGSTDVGRRILAQAVPTVKRVTLELGGKSAQIYLDDAIDRAPLGAMIVVAMTSGQACVAATRMLVPKERKDEVVQQVAAMYGTIKVGLPDEPGTLMGPLINAAAVDRCERYVALAEDAGAKVAFGGGRPDGYDKGHWFEPTVLDLPDNQNPAARDEIFGPVLGVIGYDDLDDAVAIANDSPYGLSAQVYGGDVAVATGVARRLRAGAVNVNTSLFSAYAPGGGYKQSGLGRERGVEGIRDFQEVKHMVIGDLEVSANLDWLISVDDHILEPPNLWVDRVAAKDRDRAPHMETIDGIEGWMYDGRFMPSSGLSAVAGKTKEEFSPEPLPYAEMRPGCYDAAARIEDMDRAGILASLCFPTITRFCGQLFMEAGDREFGVECLRIYNDWLIEEWCGAAPGRYIPLMLIPMWDPHLAAEEMGRMADRGVTTFAFSENPAPLGLPTIHDTGRYWDPVMSAANELGMVASMHVGSSSQVPSIAPDSPFMANLAWGAVRTSGAMLSWIFSGMFQRFPNLKIALSEGEIGWMPYFLERAEQVLDKQRFWVMKGQTFMDHAASTGVDLDTLDVRQTFRDHVYGCFIEDHHGIASLDELGEDNIMCETDYPHSDSTWPDCIDTARRVIKGLPEETQYKLLRGNAERLYRFKPAEPPARAA